MNLMNVVISIGSPFSIPDHEPLMVHIATATCIHAVASKAVRLLWFTYGYGLSEFCSYFTRYPDAAAVVRVITMTIITNYYYKCS